MSPCCEFPAHFMRRSDSPRPARICPDRVGNHLSRANAMSHSSIATAGTVLYFPSFFFSKPVTGREASRTVADTRVSGKLCSLRVGAWTVKQPQPNAVPTSFSSAAISSLRRQSPQILHLRILQLASTMSLRVLHKGSRSFILGFLLRMRKSAHCHSASALQYRR